MADQPTKAAADADEMEALRIDARALFDELGYTPSPEQIEAVIQAGQSMSDAVDGIVMQEAMNHADGFEPSQADDPELDIPFEPFEPAAGQAERPDAGRAGGNQDVQASGGQDTPAPATDKGAEGLDQFVLPGAEQSAKQALAARDKKGGIRKGSDKPVEDGLFAPKDDGRQADVEDASRRPVIGLVFNRGTPADLMPLLEFDLAQDKPKDVRAWVQGWVRKIGGERDKSRAVEVVVALDGDKPVWSGTIDEERAAPLDRDAMADRSGLVIVHNHPKDGPLSPLDVAQLWHGQFDGVVAVMQKSGEAWHAERAIDLPFGDETVKMVYRALNDADSAVKRLGQPWINEGRAKQSDMMQADSFWAMDAAEQAGLPTAVAAQCGVQPEAQQFVVLARRWQQANIGEAPPWLEIGCGEGGPCTVFVTSTTRRATSVGLTAETPSVGSLRMPPGLVEAALAVHRRQVNAPHGDDRCRASAVAPGCREAREMEQWTASF